QRLPSGPGAIAQGLQVPAGTEQLVEGTENSASTPLVVMRPILFRDSSVNQRLPSGPTVMPLDLTDAIGNSVTAPFGAIFAIALYSANHTLPSGPAVTAAQSVTGNSVMGDGAAPSAAPASVEALVTLSTARWEAAAP